MGNSKENLQNSQTDSRRPRINRRRFLGLGLVAAGSVLVPHAESTYAGGGGPQTEPPQQRTLTQNEIASLQIEAQDHNAKTQEIVNKFLSKNLRDRYGFKVEPVDMSRVQSIRSYTKSPYDQYELSSQVQLSSVDVNVGISSFGYYAANGDYRNTNLQLNVDPPNRTQKLYYIPEINDLFIPSARGADYISDFEKAINTVFELPSNKQKIEDIFTTKDGYNQFVVGEVWEAVTDDGKLVRAFVTHHGQFQLQIEPLNPPNPSH